MSQIKPLSVNFHLWEPCNYKCAFCFATFQDVKQHTLPKGHLDKEKAKKVVRFLGAFGFQKITFAGGEPTLCPWLYDLLVVSKKIGMKTAVITNGSKINDPWLTKHKPVLDWIGISVDSIDPIINRRAGRGSRSKWPDRAHYAKVCEQIQIAGYQLKLNTVVSALNQHENLSDFIDEIKPQRWKIMQVMPVAGQNNLQEYDMEIDDQTFEQYLKRIELQNPVTKIVPEYISSIRGSYLMVDPAGRFFDSVKGTHRYSETILNTDVTKALQQVDFSYEEYIARGGLYEW